MDEFEFLRNVTIGQYWPTDSFVHRLDVRAKLLAFLALIVTVTLAGSYLGNLVLIVVALWLIALARIPMNYALAGLRPTLPFIFIFALLQLVFTPSNGSPIFSFGFVTVTSESMRLVVISIARFIELILLVSLLTLTTTTTEFAHGQESLLAPLVWLRLPVHEFSLTMTIALRFVPIIAEETERLLKAQVSRGADFGGGSRWQFIQQTRKMIPLFVPLFIAALQRAEELIVAMEARGYLGGRGRTRFVEPRAAPRDFFVVLSTWVFAATMLVAPFPF